MDREITTSFGKLQDISDSLNKLVEESTADDRVILTRDQTRIVVEAIDGLWDQASETESPTKPTTFYHLNDGKQDVYLQPAAVAMIAVDKNGTALLVMVNGSNLAMEPLQWQMAKAIFLGSVEVKELPRTHGLVKA